MKGRRRKNLCLIEMGQMSGLAVSSGKVKKNKRVDGTFSVQKDGSLRQKRSEETLNKSSGRHGGFYLPSQDGVP